jgi:hypothetical protein
MGRVFRPEPPTRQVQKPVSAESRISATHASRHAIEMPSTVAAPPIRAATPEQSKWRVDNAFSIPRKPVAIEFPDGEAIGVEFRRVPSLASVDQPEVTSYDSAADRALGAHAFYVYRLAARCLASRSVAMREAGRCDGSDDHYTAEQDYWLRQAAEAGHVHALKLYAEASADPSVALARFERMWEGGYISALGRISTLYFDAARRANEQNNRIEGLAYLWLQAHLQDAAAGKGRRPYVAHLYEQLHVIQERMNPDDVDEAIRRAKELLRGNGQCCFGP